MPALQVVRAIGLAALFGLCWSTAAAQTERQPAVEAHHLPSSPQSPAFAFGLKGGGDTPTGPFTVTIYVDGHVKLVKKSSDSRLHLANPRMKVYPVGLTGLMKLAEAEHFFSMPTRITGGHPPTDVPAAFVTIYTTKGGKTVTVRGVNPTPFYELYAVLNYVAGATT